MTGPRKWLLAGLATATLAGGLTLASARDHGPPAAVATAPPPTPAVTASSAPTPVPTADPVPAALGGRDACLLARRGGRVLASHRAEAALNPASTQKILVAAAALDVLGAEHRFTTAVAALPASAAGVVPSLWLVGGGDPMLATPEHAAFVASDPRWRELRPTSLAALADAVAAAGIRHVTGGVAGDASRYGPVGFLPTWPERFVTGGDITPVSALVVNGGWTAWKPERTPAPDPVLHAAGELTRLLRERGVRVDGAPSAGTAPDETREVASVRSAPLREQLAGMLRASDNVSAEMLLRELGSGDTAAGTRAVARALEARGVHTAGLRLVDGSGLSAANRASCRTLVETLERPFGGVGLPGLLAVAGRSGTLRLRFAGTPLEGVLRAKTGWVRGIVGLAGAIDGTTVAVLQNGVPTLEDGQAVEHRVLLELAGR